MEPVLPFGIQLFLLAVQQLLLLVQAAQLSIIQTLELAAPPPYLPPLALHVHLIGIVILVSAVLQSGLLALAVQERGILCKAPVVLHLIPLA